MIIIKPDAFERQLVGKILGMFEDAEGIIRRLYSGRFTVENCQHHYAAHIGRPYYPALQAQMISGISLFVDLDLGWQLARNIALSIRVIWGVEGPRNLIHASDSFESDATETAYWFKGYPDDYRSS